MTKEYDTIHQYTNTNTNTEVDIVSDIEKKIEQILEENNGDTWQTRSIKALALCMLDIRKDIYVIRKEIKLLKWFFASALILLIVNLVR